MSNEYEINQTKKVLQEMLTENTGRHFLDSGGENGRAWQRNQGVDFEKEPRGQWGYRGELWGTKSIYHWLSEILEYVELETEMLNHLIDTVWADCSWYECRENWLEKMEEYGATGLYGSGSPESYNSYNSENALSQTILFGYYELSDKSYVILQIHGGADVRGGYTRPRIFEVVDDGADIFDFARLGCCCSGCEKSWYTDDSGNHWYASDPHYEDLDYFEMIDLDNVEDYDGTFDHEKMQEYDDLDDPLNIFSELKDGEVFVYCPYCGEKIDIDIY